MSSSKLKQIVSLESLRVEVSVNALMKGKLNEVPLEFYIDSGEELSVIREFFTGFTKE